LDKLSSRVHAQAKKIFAVLILIENSQLITDVLQQGLTDDNLPFALEAKATASGTRPRGWPSKVFESFCEKQWSFLAPVFDLLEWKTSSPPHYEFPFQTVLPWVCGGRDDTLEDQYGGFSVVRKVAIHRAHHNLLPMSLCDNEHSVSQPLGSINCLYVFAHRQ
jgi:hypothetical protein